MVPVMEKQNNRDCGSNGDSAAWLGRSNFSRSVFHPVNKNELLNMPLALGEKTSLEHKDDFHRETSKHTRPQELLSKYLLKRSNFARQKSEISYAAFQDENTGICYDSCSAQTSPKSKPFTQNDRKEPRRSLSLPFSESNNSNECGDKCCSREEHSVHEHNGDGVNQPGVGRAASWSEYFEISGNEYAVDEAEEWMVDLSELFLGCKFASGAHSRLYRGKYKDLDVAVKILRKPDNDEKVSVKLEQQFISEVNVLSRIRHRNIVKFIGACRKPPVCCIITEYLPLGSLRSYLHNQPPLPLSLKLIINMALDIAHGMEYLHSQGVIHRDLKSENLIISDDLCIKVTDFGAAYFQSESCTVSDEFGTYRWMAPEMIRDRKFSKKADVYSFGIVLWELITRQLPFEDLSPVQAAFAVVHKNARPPLPLHCPNVLSQLMNNCWSTDPDKRPEFSEVVVLLESSRDSIHLQRTTSILPRPHKHTHGLLRCFGCAKSASPLQ